MVVTLIDEAAHGASRPPGRGAVVVGMGAGRVVRSSYGTVAPAEELHDDNQIVIMLFGQANAPNRAVAVLQGCTAPQNRYLPALPCLSRPVLAFVPPAFPD